MCSIKHSRHKAFLYVVYIRRQMDRIFQFCTGHTCRDMTVITSAKHEGYIQFGPKYVARGLQTLFIMREERLKHYKNERDKSFKMLRTRNHFEILFLPVSGTDQNILSIWRIGCKLHLKIETGCNHFRG